MSDVIIKKGRLVAHHFAHRPESDCGYGAGETALHRAAKEAVFDALSAHPAVGEVDIEAPVGGNRADVLFSLRANPQQTSLFGSVVTSPPAVAVEIQRSSLSESDIVARTWKYTCAGVAVIWVIAEDEPTLSRRGEIRTKSWHRGIYDTMGRVYVWCGGATVIPVRLSAMMGWDGQSQLEAKKRSIPEEPVHLAEMRQQTKNGYLLWGGARYWA